MQCSPAAGHSTARRQSQHLWKLQGTPASDNGSTVGGLGEKSGERTKEDLTGKIKNMKVYVRLSQQGEFIRYNRVHNADFNAAMFEHAETCGFKRWTQAFAPLQKENVRILTSNLSISQSNMGIWGSKDNALTGPRRKTNDFLHPSW